MNDPRDKRFHALRKKDRSQLSPSEVSELIGYCDQMIPLVRGNKGRRSWIALKADLEAWLQKSR